MKVKELLEHLAVGNPERTIITSDSWWGNFTDYRRYSSRDEFKFFTEAEVLNWEIVIMHRPRINGGCTGPWDGVQNYVLDVGTEVHINIEAVKSHE